jgi:hypothetical protein
MPAVEAKGRRFPQPAQESHKCYIIFQDKNIHLTMAIGLPDLEAGIILGRGG